jgi:glycosyltransferase involved in cell wall biosynthesis
MPVGAMAEHITGKPSHGLWIDALKYDFERYKNHDLIIATIGNVKEILKIEKEGIVYYLLPGGTTTKYRCNNIRHLNDWKQIIEECKPDLIQVWGSEFQHGLAALRVAEDIPAVIYMQGLAESLSRYYFAGMTQKELKKAVTFRDIIEQNTIVRQQRNWERQAPYEKELLNRAGNIIGENRWCRAHCSSIAPDARYYVCPLSINEAFFEQEWSLDKAEDFTIMCNAANYPLKGLQTVFRAIPLIRRRYPKVKLIVPGNSLRQGTDFKSRLKNTGFDKYIKSLISELGIENNVEFVGRLTQPDMAKLMTRTRVFVMCSALENHSSTLKEAMAVGIPCVASNVGGVPEYVIHGENGFLYRYEEYEMIAEYVCELFESDELCEKFSRNGRANMMALHSGNDVYRMICEIYESILRNS